MLPRHSDTVQLGLGSKNVRVPSIDETNAFFRELFVDESSKVEQLYRAFRQHLELECDNIRLTMASCLEQIAETMWDPTFQLRILRCDFLHSWPVRTCTRMYRDLMSMNF